MTGSGKVKSGYSLRREHLVRNVPFALTLLRPAVMTPVQQSALFHYDGISFVVSTLLSSPSAVSPPPCSLQKSS